ncbi:DUF4328 domain-containing protein [Qipengyuania sphaerica]|uniref:DUF4328 domain-containing protein n=1 Tax=Qipengyuania sphaerica TaxID=2867243 RepID=UPI001C88B52A|nr:DUF4328 domain-containing protein [Qipengyuania sphaerica]MBX7540142.1 DUF4328 domain-containing protein [Qipengyuania sphaerica]
MDREDKLRGMRKSSLVVTVFAALLVLTGLTQIGLAGVAVSEEYERIERFEELTRQRTYYGYQAQQAALQNEYNRSSSAFFLQGRFIPDSETMTWTSPAVLALIALVLSALGFLVSAMVWVWRAHANMVEAGWRPKYGPQIAVVGYLVPLMNLVVPFEAMRELYNRSNGEGDDFAHSTAEDVTAWWTAVLVGMLVFSVMTFKLLVDAGTNLILMTPLWMEYGVFAFGFILILGGAYLFSSLTRKITVAQEEFLPELDAGPIEDEAHRRMTVNIVSGQ